MVFSSQVSASRYQYLPLRSILYTHTMSTCKSKSAYKNMIFVNLALDGSGASNSLQELCVISVINPGLCEARKKHLAEQAGPAEFSPASCPLVLGLFIQQGIGCLHKLLLHLCLSESAKWGIPSSKVALIVLYIHIYIFIFFKHIQTKRENPMLTPREFLSLKGFKNPFERPSASWNWDAKSPWQIVPTQHDRTQFRLFVLGTPDTYTLRPLPKWRNECFSASKCRR